MHEVEIRGLLTSSEFETFKAFLEQNATFEKTFKRLSVEISPGFDPATRTWSQRKLNLRIKKSDDEEKLSLKIGDTLQHTLEEHEVVFESGKFLEMLQIFAALGFDSGLIYFWESWVYEYQGVEIKVSKYTDEYMMWEIEARDNTSLEKAKERVYQIAEQLNLNPLTPEEYDKELTYQNKTIFELFNLENLNHFMQKMN
jgi:adenylate cyclase class IV